MKISQLFGFVRQEKWVHNEFQGESIVVLTENALTCRIVTNLFMGIFLDTHFNFELFRFKDAQIINHWEIIKLNSSLS